MLCPSLNREWQGSVVDVVDRISATCTSSGPKLDRETSRSNGSKAKLNKQTISFVPPIYELQTGARFRFGPFQCQGSLIRVMGLFFIRFIRHFENRQNCRKAREELTLTTELTNSLTFKFIARLQGSAWK